MPIPTVGCAVVHFSGSLEAANMKIAAASGRKRLLGICPGLSDASWQLLGQPERDEPSPISRGILLVGVGIALEGMRIQQQFSKVNRWPRTSAFMAVLLALAAGVLLGQSPSKTSDKKNSWRSIEFAIVRFNDSAPNAWNIYHGEKKGLLLVRLWKRYLLVNVQDEEVFDIDPQKIVVKGNAVEWSMADKPDKPIETPEWKERNLGNMERVRFRLGKDGHFLEMQIPLDPTGKAIY